MKRAYLAVAILICVLAAPLPAAEDLGKTFVNSIGMKFVRIEPGTFRMGQLQESLPWEILPHTGGRGDRMDILRQGDFDEKPHRQVTISKSFYMCVFEVTNYHYELFDRDHKKLRGKHAGLSKDDDEAVINVNWYDADGFCRWLSEREGRPYRLPTEAEWEYACRAGTTTAYHTGDKLPENFYKNATLTKGPEAVPLHVGKTQANAWGLYDMHGNVEEWCNDWYGDYQAGPVTDPVGCVDGDFRVLRGGSHSVEIYDLRSANRMGTLPEDKHWLIGFRVVLGEMPDTEPLPEAIPPLPQRDVVQNRDRKLVTKGPDPGKPYFAKPKVYMNIPTGSEGPLFGTHNHDPAIVECPNGDLLSIWYTCDSERNRELGQAVSRLRWGADQWEPAISFWDAPDRNDHGPALWFDGDQTIYHICGLAFSHNHHAMTTIMRTSKDSGATWSRARMIIPEYAEGHMPVEAVIRRSDGAIVFTTDDSPSTWFSLDEGLTWSSGIGAIRGVHPAVAELNDGRMIGFTRGAAIDGKMPVVLSDDKGVNWVHKASEFPSISGGQRLVLLRLREGPLFFASLASNGIMIKDSSGKQRKVHGLFCAISEDDGKTWPYKRLITDDGPGTVVQSTNGGALIMSGSGTEYRGYTSVCQGLDGVINVISSKSHYAFNLKWAMTLPEPLKYPPIAVKPVIESFNGPDKFDTDGWIDRKSYRGRFNGKGQYTMYSSSRSNGINRIVGAGSFEMNIAVANLKFNPIGVRTTPGVAIHLEDARTNTAKLRVERDHISFSGDNTVHFGTPPESVKLKFIWNQDKKQLRAFYEINGDEAKVELPASKNGVYMNEPFSENLSIGLLGDQISMDLDYYEVKPL